MESEKSIKNKINLKKFIAMLLCACCLLGTYTAAFEPAVVYAATQAPKLNKTKISGRLGNTYKLKLSGTDSKVTFKSDNTAVVKINSKGKMTFRSPGKTTVYAIADGKSYECAVTVAKPKITVSAPALGETKAISLGGKKYKGVKYSSSAPDVVSVDSDGNMTALSKGKAVITVTIQKYSYKKTVKVKAASNTTQSNDTAGSSSSTNAFSSVSKTVAKAAQKLYDQVVTSDMSQVEKLRAVHDAIVTTTEYDHDSYLQGNIPDVSFTIEGVLINHLAVCQGYAETMKLFLDEIGIENVLIYGYGYSNGSSEGHVWNLVKLDGDWYHVDATWDDPIFYGEKPDNYICYDYFLIDDVTMSRDHSWIESDYPAANGGRYSTYIVEAQLAQFREAGELLDSSADLEAACIERIRNGQMTFTLVYPGPERDGFEVLMSICRQTGMSLTMYTTVTEVGDYIALDIEFSSY